jgi:hypothetical protein
MTEPVSTNKTIPFDHRMISLPNPAHLWSIAIRRFWAFLFCRYKRLMMDHVVRQPE